MMKKGFRILKKKKYRSEYTGRYIIEIYEDFNRQLITTRGNCIVNRVFHVSKSVKNWNGDGGIARLTNRRFVYPFKGKWANKIIEKRQNTRFRTRRCIKMNL